MARRPTPRPADGLDQFQDAAYNPRIITPAARDGLRRSLAVFGDLSGFVCNRRTGNVVCGHQRRAVLAEIDLSAVDWGTPYTCELGFPDARFTSHERDGHVTTPAGARFHVREVDWPIEFERVANLEANNPHIMGDWTEELDQLLDEVKADVGDTVAVDLLLDELRAEAPVGMVELNDDCDDEAFAEGQQFRESTVAVFEITAPVVFADDETFKGELRDLLDRHGLEFKVRR